MTEPCSLSPTLLLVEDSPDDVFFMKRALQSAEVTLPLQVASSGEEAIAYLSGRDKFADRVAFPLPLLVLLDLKLPVRDGHEVLAWIRQQPSLKTLVVIMMTTSKERSDVQKAYSLGANAYLVKPAAAAQLVEQVKAVKKFWLEHNAFAPLGA
jgi:CheY-like chemotaxis protein